ncbi:hypothetical protein ACWJJH_06270 [Endozoicomonadaceae bacterium StTr2]
MNLALVFNIDTLKMTKSGPAPEDSVTKHIYYKAAMPTGLNMSNIRASIASKLVQNRALGGRLARESYILHYSRMTSLMSVIMEKQVLSATPGQGVNLVVIGTNPAITTETVQNIFRAYTPGPRESDYVAQNVILMIYSSGADRDNIVSAFARDYKVAVWTASQQMAFRSDGTHSSFEYVDQSFEGHESADAWTVIDPAGAVYYFDNDERRCREAGLKGFAGWCDNAPGLFNAGLELAEVKIGTMF